MIYVRLLPLHQFIVTVQKLHYSSLSHYASCMNKHIKASVEIMSVPKFSSDLYCFYKVARITYALFRAVGAFRWKPVLTC